MDLLTIFSAFILLGAYMLLAYVPSNYTNFSSLNKLNKKLMIAKAIIIISTIIFYLYKVLKINISTFDIKKLIIYLLGFIMFLLNLLILKLYNELKLFMNTRRLNLDAEYVRQIPEKLPITYTSFISSKKLKFDKTIKLTIQNLYCKGAIDLKLDGNKTIINKTNKIINLSNRENYIYNYLFSSDKSKFNVRDWNKIIRNELLNSEFIIEIKKYKRSKQYFTIFSIFFLILLVYYFKYGFLTSQTNYVLNMIMDSTIISLIPLALIAIYEKFNIFSNLDLTKEGYVFKKELNLLKKYLKEFTLLEEREIKEIPLWKEYLVYAQILNVNFKYKNIKDLKMKKLSKSDLNDYINNFIYVLTK